MIFSRRDLDIERYPAIKRHLDSFRERLEPKPRGYAGSKWPGRKEGGYKWFELQDPIEYWREFEKPKIFYQVIQFHPRYSLDTEGTLGNDKTFFLPTADLFLLAVMNSPLMWWFNWHHLVHMKDEALTPLGYLMGQLPIPDPLPAARKRAKQIVGQLIDLTGGRTSGLRALLDWLHVELGAELSAGRLSELVDRSPEELVAAVSKTRPKKAGLTAAQLHRLRAEYTASVVPMREQGAKAAALERELSDLVNAAYGLTPADVALMWQTAPPRMPITPP